MLRAIAWWESCGLLDGKENEGREKEEKKGKCRKKFREDEKEKIVIEVKSIKISGLLQEN